MLQLEIFTAIYLQVLRINDDNRIGAVDETVAPRHVGHLACHLREEDILHLVVHQELGAIIHEDASTGVHQQLTSIAIARLHGDTLKVVLPRIAANAVHRGYP